MQSRNEVKKQQNQAGAQERICKTCCRICKLVDKLHVVTVEPTASDFGGSIKMCDVICSEETSKEVTDQASYTVDAENVETELD
jgi:hypothetical protein